MPIHPNFSTPPHFDHYYHMDASCFGALTINGRIRRRHNGTDSVFRTKLINALFHGEARRTFLALPDEQQEVAVMAALKFSTSQWNNIGHQLTATEVVLLEGWLDRRLPKLEHGDVLSVRFPGGCILDIDSEYRVVHFQKGHSVILTIIDDPIKEHHGG